ncbi:hypothetical protein C4K68_14550 [Pokkaliibacter plantistimulans]|uniref:FAD dependent oxidoreductase domain-containing protein n=1 Tax=Proteobacteria bacterium 228 TaxID=2083153 RepID=A0A2S5KPW7_9PROT|nr:FAD-binding oxidoreductase [Pokkaliibacter plantistimulans]PPC76589.1 hypothetical protein C4K68_14550 [Pokkaliibacter plantistimulans]
MTDIHTPGSKRTLGTDVIIIGGGIVGASAALALRQKGVAVVLLERDFCGSRSSGINYGGVRRQGRLEAQLPLSQRAHHIWARLPELIGIDGEYVRSGHLKLGVNERDMASLENYAQMAARYELPLEILDQQSLRRRFPWISPTALGGSYCAEDGHANPRLVSPAFAHAARRLGAQIFDQTPVSSIEHDGQRFIVECQQLQVRAPLLINCAGAWGHRIAAWFDEQVPLQVSCPNMTVTEPLPLFMDASIGIEGGSIYARQVSRGNCVIGGGQGYTTSDTTARPGREAILELMKIASALFPALANAHLIRFWSGIEGNIPDRNPVVGPSHTTPGLFHGFGFCGAGFQIGPAVGEVLAELIDDGHTPTPIDAFAINRFSTASSTLMSTCTVSGDE